MNRVKELKERISLAKRFKDYRQADLLRRELKEEIKKTKNKRYEQDI